MNKTETKYNKYNPTPSDWNPVLKGDIYCSPSCGCNCTKASYDGALCDASKLALTMGLGWGYRVWENCKWYYSVRKDNVSIDIHIVYNENVNSYSCYFNSNPQIITENESPELAYREAFELFNSHIESLISIKKELEI